ncbi:MAG: hypothetical protein IPF81_02665 [Bacteroidetes bacterium]|nr:hypothetical protein [Bacteroidota bacterium]MBP6401781.1 hypothetical protein [Bacteroidia bacterium]MBP6647987.1 hypothetical protein [Bacteroidia bacterium]
MKHHISKIASATCIQQLQHAPVPPFLPFLLGPLVRGLTYACSLWCLYEKPVNIRREQSMNH